MKLQLALLDDLFYRGTGPTGNCTYSCISRGELIVNGGMENVINDKPTGWIFTNPDNIISENSQGRVHSRNWSVNIEDDATLSQVINNIEPGCFYELSFFARSEGDQVSLNANGNQSLDLDDVSLTSL